MFLPLEILQKRGCKEFICKNLGHVIWGYNLALFVIFALYQHEMSLLILQINTSVSSTL